MVIYLAIIDESRNFKKLPDMLPLLGDKSLPTTSLTVMSDFQIFSAIWIANSKNAS